MLRGVPLLGTFKPHVNIRLQFLNNLTSYSIKCFHARDVQVGKSRAKFFADFLSWYFWIFRRHVDELSVKMLSVFIVLF